MLIFPRLILSLLLLLLLQGCATAVLTGAAATVGIDYDRRTAGAIIDDQNIELKAATILYDTEPLYQNSHINITSYNGTVLLTGEVLSANDKQQVYQLIQPIQGVHHIHNELMISPISSMTARSSDTWLTSKVLAKMTADEALDPYYIKVVTENSTVYLMGIVYRSEAMNAAKIASTTAGVKRVVKIFEYLD